MTQGPVWTIGGEEECMHKWTSYLHAKARGMFLEDGMHASIIFLFSKENGLVSVNMVPPDIDHQQVDSGIVNAVQNDNLFGVILIGEAWVYFGKENDHTCVQLLDGEMKVSELTDEDKKDVLLITMENRAGDSVTYMAQILRDENGIVLDESTMSQSPYKKWIT